jgi:hypothetical protein
VFRAERGIQEQLFSPGLKMEAAGTLKPLRSYFSATQDVSHVKFQFYTHDLEYVRS